MGWFLSRSDAVSPARAVARPVLLLCGVWGAPFLTHCFCDGGHFVSGCFNIVCVILWFHLVILCVGDPDVTLASVGCSRCLLALFERWPSFWT